MDISRLQQRRAVLGGRAPHGDEHPRKVQHEERADQQTAPASAAHPA